MHIYLAAPFLRVGDNDREHPICLACRHVNLALEEIVVEGLSEKDEKDLLHPCHVSDDIRRSSSKTHMFQECHAAAFICKETNDSLDCSLWVESRDSWNEGVER